MKSLLLAMLFGLFSVFTGQAEESMRVGVIIPLSGPVATMGQSLEGAFRLAEHGSVAFQFEDDQCDAKKGLAAYQKLREQGLRIFYVGCSGSIMAIAPYAKTRGDLVLASYSGSAAVRNTGPEVIRFNPDAQSVAEAMIALFEERSEFVSYTDIALFYEEQDYAASLAALLKKGLGSRIRFEESYLATQPSFKTQLVRLARSRAQVVLYVPVSDVATAVQFKEMKELKWSIPILGDVNVCDFPQQPGVFGLRGACFAPRFLGQEYLDFQELYKKKMGKPSQFPFYDAITFDIVHILGKFAAQRRKVTAQELRDFLLGGVSGVVGQYRFDQNGEVLGGRDYLHFRAFP